MNYIKHAGREDFDIALADPPYGKGYAEALIEAFRDHPFASRLWVEHGKGDLAESLMDHEQRRYGETVISTLEAER